jgi:hypothetical protein
MGNEKKIFGITISLTTLSFISLAIFLKALTGKYNTFFMNNIDYFFWGSLFLVILFVSTGAISIGSLLTKPKYG